MEGFSFTIPCGFGRLDEAPFWIINDAVYELFSVPRHFPFIPAVTTYSFLTVPIAYRSLDGYTFQCSTFRGDEMELGMISTIRVIPGEWPSSSFKASLCQACTPIEGTAL